MWRIVSVAAIAGLTALSSGCSKPESSRQPQTDSAKETVKQKSIEEVLAEHTQEWMAIPGVIGTGIGEYESAPCIKVLVLQKTDSLIERIPKVIDGYVVTIEETGEIRAH